MQSIDGNANVGHKDIVSLENEMAKPHSKLLGFHKIFCELKKEYGVQVANDWLTAEWIGWFYLHDAYNSTFKPYCYAYDTETLVRKGMFFVNDFNAQPAQHLVTYTDFIAEFISWCCNRTSGAVGVPSFLVYSYYYWKKDVDNGYFMHSPTYYRDQEFQRIIYKLNQPYLVEVFRAHLRIFQFLTGLTLKHFLEVKSSLMAPLSLTISTI